MNMYTRFVFCFSYNGTRKLLANVTNIGTYVNADLKLSFSKRGGIVFGDKGINYDGDIDDKHTFTTNNVEFSYHKDGSYLRKLPKNPHPHKYFNPGGTGMRCEPLNEVKTIICLAIIDVQNYNICDNYLQENKKSLLVELKEDNLFDGEPFSAIIFVKNKNFIVNKLTCELFYSTYVDLSSELELGIYIQRIEKKYPEKVYSKALKSYIYTTIGNTISLCNNSKNIIPFIPLVTNKEIYKMMKENSIDILPIKLK